MKLVQGCYLVAQSFKSTEIRTIPQTFLHHKQMIDVVRMTWVFPETEENFNDFIALWHGVGLSYYAYHTHWRYKKYPISDRLGGTVFGNLEWQEYYNRTAAFIEDLADKVEKDLDELPEWQRFYEIASALGKRNFYVLQGEFTGWALPKLLETQAALSDEIDPKIWSETLSAVSKSEQKENIE